MTRRTSRVNSIIRQEISDLLLRQIKDPRLGNLVTVTEVSTSPDLRHAKVFVSIMGSKEEKEEAFKGLAGAAGFFRKELAQRLRFRQVPEVSFHQDTSIEQGARLLELIEQVSISSNVSREHSQASEGTK